MYVAHNNQSFCRGLGRVLGLGGDDVKWIEQIAFDMLREGSSIEFFKDAWE